FVMVDQRDQAYLDRGDQERIAWLCDRRFGIGRWAILLQHVAGYDFGNALFQCGWREGVVVRKWRTVRSGLRTT
ncbi:MAG: hypothetical protein IPN74_17825, partial [Haliscomenobacter sp.]|nr:hypothetical protein [Haliscomenobacter sp.]